MFGHVGRRRGRPRIRENNMSKRIGVGVISLGWMGRLHARSYRALAERYQGLGAEVRLVAACDPVEAARDEAVAALGFERAYADYHELLADPEVDVVSICSPNFLHHEIALAAVAAIVWSRERLGLERAAAALGAGMILSNLHLLRSSDNPWKFGLGAAVCIVVLAGVQRYGRGTQLVAATVLGVLYLIHDSRATTGMLMLIVALLIWQIVSAGLTVVEPSPGRLRTHQILLLAGLASAAVVVIVAASLAGYLGQDAQQRTSAQAHGTTNLVLAARPELGASWALITHRPWGYGAGVQPRYEDVSTAMQGMASLNYNPDNGYVRNYMFGHGFELHSGLVDAWIALSLPGAALVAYMIWLALRALWENLGTPRLRSWLLFTVLFVLMNAAVGPLSVLPSYLVLVAAAGLPSAATGRAVPGRSR